MDDDQGSPAGDQPDARVPSDGAPQPPHEGDVEEEAATNAQGTAGASGEAPEPAATTGPGEQPSAAAEETGGRASGPRVEIGIAEGDLRVVGGAVHVTLHQRRGRYDEANSPIDRDGTLFFARVSGGAELQ